jgi:murein DD-endopeptidase MepM/ murein hydrolase activator NlpD
VEGQAVKAAREGKIVFADYLSGYAFTVIVDHLDDFYSVYSQNADFLVKNGDFVRKGDTLAHTGQDGNESYLHFEIRKKTRAENPLHYLP